MTFAFQNDITVTAGCDFCNISQDLRSFATLARINGWFMSRIWWKAWLEALLVGLRVSYPHICYLFRGILPTNHLVMGSIKVKDSFNLVINKNCSGNWAIYFNWNKSCKIRRLLRGNMGCLLHSSWFRKNAKQNIHTVPGRTWEIIFIH